MPLHFKGLTNSRSLYTVVNTGVQATATRLTSNVDGTAAMQVARNVNQSSFQQMIRLSTASRAWNSSALRPFRTLTAPWVNSATSTVDSQMCTREFVTEHDQFSLRVYDSYHYKLPFDVYAYNNNNNNHDDIYGAVIMA